MKQENRFPASLLGTPNMLVFTLSLEETGFIFHFPNMFEHTSVISGLSSFILLSVPSQILKLL